MDVLDEYKGRGLDKLRLIQPHWHIQKAAIDLSAQGDEVVEDLSSSGFEIYMASVSDLFQVTPDVVREVYEREALWNDSEDDRIHDEEKLARVLKCWEEKHPLTPPTLIDNGHGEVLIQDGRHRLKTAIFLGVHEVPVIIYNSSWEKIRHYFDPRRVS